MGLTVFEAKVLLKASRKQLHHAITTLRRLHAVGLVTFSFLGDTAMANLTQKGWAALQEAKDLGMLSGKEAE